MDKGRHPNVIRTWTVERTKSPYRPPQPVQPSPAKGNFRRPDRRPGAAPPVKGPKS
jgi:hypothetical protein